MSLKERACPQCGQEVIEITFRDRDKMTVNWHPSPNGNIIIKGSKATVMRDSARAEALLRRLGFPEVDRYLRHECAGRRKNKSKRRRKKR